MAGVTRRSVLAAGAVVALPRAVMALPNELNFSVQRGGTEIGRHELRFARGGNGFTVDIRIEYAAASAAYRYQHRSREIWSDDRLVSLDARTTEGGRSSAVTGHAVPEGFRVTSTNQLLDARVVPTSWWNTRLLSERQALSTLTGQLLPITVANLGVETVEAWGRPIDATHYRIGGGVQVDLWFDDRATWVKSRFAEAGGGVDYVLT